MLIPHRLLLQIKNLFVLFWFFSRHMTSLHQNYSEKKKKRSVIFRSFSGIWDRGRGKGEKRKHIPVVKASDATCTPFVNVARREGRWAGNISLLWSM